jgi:hypothetical protein
VWPEVTTIVTDIERIEFGSNLRHEHSQPVGTLTRTDPHNAWSTPVTNTLEDQFELPWCDRRQRVEPLDLFGRLIAEERQRHMIMLCRDWPAGSDL